MVTPILPRAQSAINDGGSARTEWYEFFRLLLQFVGENSGIAAEIEAILDRLAALEDETDDFVINGPISVQVDGTPGSGAVTLRLRGDSLTPGALHYYGTNVDGEKGWFERLLSTLADVDYTTPPVAGNALLFNGTAWAPGAAASDSSVPYFIPDGETYTVPVNKQALFTIPIVLSIGSSLLIDGILVEVD